MKRIAIIVSVIIIAAVVISYSFWLYQTRIIRDTVKEIIEKNSEISSSSVEVGGFPFHKIVVINDFTIGATGADKSNTTVDIKKLTISSSILSGNKFRADVGSDIAIKNDLYPERNSYIEFEKTPYITFSLYKDGKLKNFSYEDAGYKVIDNDGFTAYSAGTSLAGLDSIIDGNDYTYRLALSFQNLKNFRVIDNPTYVSMENSLNPVMENNLTLDVIIHKVVDDNLLPVTSELQINNLDFKNDLYAISVSGSFISDKKDLFPYGKVRISIKHLDNLITAVSEIGNDLMNSKGYTKAIGTGKNPSFGIVAHNVLNNLRPVLKSLATKNPESNRELSIFKIERAIGTPNYYINGKKISDILNEFLKSNSSNNNEGK